MKNRKYFIVPLGAALVVCFVFGLAGFAQQNSEEPAAEELQTTQGDAVKSHAYLGLGVSSLHPALQSQMSNIIGKGRGVTVENVTKDSPAHRAGFQLHDLLISYDKQDVYSPEQLVKLVRNDKPGRDVVLGFVRGGELHEATVKLGKALLREPVRPGLGFRFPLKDNLVEFDLQRFGLRPDSGLLESLPDDASHWMEFQSMSVTKKEDGNYRAEINYSHDKESIERVFEGTRNEIKDAIKADQELPQQVKNHILRAMDERPNIRELIPQDFFRGLNGMERDFFNRDFLNRRLLQRELFSWPDVDF